MKTQFGLDPSQITFSNKGVAKIFCSFSLMRKIVETKNAGFLECGRFSVLLSRRMTAIFWIDSNSISLIRSFLTCRTQKVCLETVCSDWINLYQGVPQGTILGPLLFNIYVNSMDLHVTEPVKIVQYADDTFLLVGINHLERVIENLLVFFQNHQLNLKATKTEFIIFSKKSKNQEKNYELTVSNQKVSHTKTIRYLGILLDENCTYQDEVKNILKKTACGIKTLYSIRDLFPEKIWILLLDALVVSQLQYSSVLLNGIAQNLKTTLKKQLNWGIKAIFYRKKFEFWVFKWSKNRTQNIIRTDFVRLENELLLLEIEKPLSSCLYWKWNFFTYKNKRKWKNRKTRPQPKSQNWLRGTIVFQ